MTPATLQMHCLLEFFPSQSLTPENNCEYAVNDNDCELTTPLL